MIRSASKAKIEYGDFQTPIELAQQVCQKLIELKVDPEIIIEPTCGVGNFIEAAARSFRSSREIIGFEINAKYLEASKAKKQHLQDERIALHHADFFQLDWSKAFDQVNGNVLILGNFPWVTNSQQGSINSKNLPIKSNFQHHSGLDAITGKSNFDISEWMLIQVVQELQGRNAELAMLCKTSVSRKLLKHIYTKQLNLAECITYKIDTKKHFNANVEACLIFCRFDTISKNYFCNTFSSFDALKFEQIGYYNDVFLRNTAVFEKTLYLSNNDGQQWRSGVKHDCSNVMEFRKVGQHFLNSLGEVAELEDTYLFPLIKGSDVAQNRIKSIDRYVLVTQKYVGEPTEPIKELAPKTWHYLTTHTKYLQSRKSRVYQNSPDFSIFGVGSYTFEPWKIAICGLYKKLEFRLIGEINGKAAIFDDTVYFLSFSNEETARRTFALLTSKRAIEFYSSLIFWDEKRPIKASILNRLNLLALDEIIKT